MNPLTPPDCRTSARRFGKRSSSNPMTTTVAHSRPLAPWTVITLTSLVSEEFERTHGRVAGGEMVVLGLGRLGGRALTHASDLPGATQALADAAARGDYPTPAWG